MVHSSGPTSDYLPAQPAEGPAVSAVIVQIANKARIWRAAQVLMMLCLAALTAMYNYQDSGTYVAFMPIYFLLGSVGFAMAGMAKYQYLRIDATGILEHWPLMSHRLLWADIVQIEEQNHGAWLTSKWGIFLATREGGHFVEDKYALGRSSLIIMLRQRWRDAGAASSGSPDLSDPDTGMDW